MHHAVSADDATFCETVIAPLADLAAKGGNDPIMKSLTKSMKEHRLKQ